MSYLYSSWKSNTIEASGKTGALVTRLRLQYTTTEAADKYTVDIVNCGVEAYITGNISYSDVVGRITLVKSSDTWAKKNYYYDYSDTNHTSTFKRSANVALALGTSAAAPVFTLLDSYTALSYDISKQTSALKTTLKLWGSLKLLYTSYMTNEYGSDSSPSSVTINIPALASYTVSYGANGGSGAPANQTKYYGINLTLSATSPTRSGYSFVGWNTSASATSASYQPGGTYTGNAALTLYAIWSKTLTLSYNANGGSGAPSSQSSTIYNSTTSAAFTVSNTTPTKSGYTFLGWSTSSTATSASYSAGSSISISANTTLYAVWRKQLTLSYNANGGSGAPASSSQYVYNATTSASFTVSSTAPTRSGYTFLGWGTSSTATSASYSGGSTISISANTTLYAIWRKQLTLSFDANGGSGAPGSMSGYIYNSTASYTFTLPTTKPSRNNWSFLGWSTSSSAATASYQPGGTISISADTKLYAVWQAQYNWATISDLSVVRCLSNGTLDDEGTYAKVTFNWSGTIYGDTACTPSSIAIYSKQGSGSYTQKYINSSPTGTSGSVSQIIGTYDTDKVYDIKAAVNNHGTLSESYDVLTTAYFVIDINKKGTAIGFFGSGPDNDEGLFVYKGIKADGDVNISGSYKINGTGIPTGVKGNAESTYRTGNVNLTPANIGAVSKSGDTMTGDLTMASEKDIVLTINTSATSGTDYELYQALKALGWQSLA